MYSPDPKSAMRSGALLDYFRRDRARGTNDDIDLTLRPAFLDLLGKIGNPHLKLPPVFHVAGTNGKGSTCAFLRAILEAAGYRVHVYTSPHLVRFHERIRVAGELIHEDELVELLTLFKNISPPASITYFEAATAAAFAAFTRHVADFTIVEVGLGGRLDATNVIPKPLASLITRLSYDHRDYLGDTMTAIATEKAGIMRKGVPCFSTAQPDVKAMKALYAYAKKIGAPLHVASQDWEIRPMTDGFQFNDRKHSFDLPSPALPGLHQYENAGLAIAALLGSAAPKVSAGVIGKGLQNVAWPARLQRLTTGALAARLPEGVKLWLDGGHNDSAGEMLARQAKLWQEQDGLPLHLILGMLTTKKPAEFLGPLQPFVASLTTIPIPDEVASYTADDLSVVARGAGVQEVMACDDIFAVLKNLTIDASPKRILICGSLYLAGHVLRENQRKI